MSHLLMKAIAEHKNEAVRAESKARVLQVLQGTRIEVVIELLEELLEHLRAIVKEEEAPEDEEPEDEEEEGGDDGDEGEEISEQARSENPSDPGKSPEGDEGSQGLRARPHGREIPSEARDRSIPSKASQVRAALAGGPLPRDRVVMQLAALPPGADATTRENRRTIQAWRQMLSNLQRQGDLEVLAGDVIGLTTVGKERVVMGQQLSAFRESLSAPAPAPTASPEPPPPPPPQEEPQEEEGGEEDERLARRRREEERAVEAAWVETEALVLGVFHKAKRAMNYRDVVEEMAGRAPQILIRSLQDVAPHTRLGAVVRKTLLRLQTAGKVTTDTLDSSRWKLRSGREP